MKKSILFSVLLVLSVLFTSQAVVRTVSNDGFTPAQFTGLQAAIDASNPGDTLYVHGSPSSYGDLTIGKRLVFVGNGVNQFDGTKRSILSNVYLYAGAAGDVDGTTFLGLDISALAFCYSPQIGPGGFKISNVSFIRSYVRALNAYNPSEGGGASAVLLLQCPQISSLNLNGFSSVIVQNSNFLGGAGIGGGSIEGSYIFNNCLFFGYVPYNYSGFNGLGNFNQLTSGLFQNCIFAKWFFGTLAGCIFNKCLTYGCNNDNISPTGAILTNCLIGQNPLFVLPPLDYVDGAFSTDQQVFDPSFSNFNFQSGSPCINAGLDGKNLGPTGGSNPFNYLTQSAPQIPRMKEVTVLSGQTLGTTGGTIQVQIKAKRQD